MPERPLRRKPIPHVAARSPRDAVGAILAVAIAAVFAALLLQTVDFSLGTHADEPSKVVAILSHRDTYRHPILMLELVRAANAIAGFTDHQQVVELGRACALLAGALAVFATFLLARAVLPAPVALAAAAVTAVTPLVAMHARYLKEDIFVLPFIVLSLLAFIESSRRRPSPARSCSDSPSVWRRRQSTSGSSSCRLPPWSCWWAVPTASTAASG